VLIDLGAAQNRMGGSILAQTLGQRSVTTVPDLDDPQDLKALVAAVNELRAAGKILAYHDRSDGGLLATVAEMAFAGQVGVALNVDMLVTEGDGISDSRMDGRARTGPAGERPPRRLTLKALFNEELGVVLQVRTAERNAVMQVLRAHGLSRTATSSARRGRPRPAWTRARASSGLARRQEVFSAPAATCTRCGTRELEDRQQRDNPACADAEHAAAGDPATPACMCPTSTRPENVAALPEAARPRVAILREQGVNSHVEMAYAFTEAGFEAFDVHMTDLQPARWPTSRAWWPAAASATATRWARASAGRARSPSTRRWPSSSGLLRRATPLAWACATAARCLPSWPTSSPAQAWPRFTTNQSERFEARLSLVEVLDSPSLFLQAWPAAACRSRWRTARATPTSVARQCRRSSRPCASWTTTASRPSSTRSTPTAAPAA
jgi:phosphoribosylformylglycinamidine synthase